MPSPTSCAVVYRSLSPEGTRALGRAVGRLLRMGDLLALVGKLGSGKTCFVGGLAEGMRVEGRVSSPSFIIARFHPGPVPLVHADAYRIGPEDILDLGLSDWLAEAAVALEWADRVEKALPEDRVTLALSMADDARIISLTASGARSRQLLEAIARAHPCHRDLQREG